MSQNDFDFSQLEPAKESGARGAKGSQHGKKKKGHRKSKKKGWHARCHDGHVRCLADWRSSDAWWLCSSTKIQSRRRTNRNSRRQSTRATRLTSFHRCELTSTNSSTPHRLSVTHSVAAQPVPLSAVRASSRGRRTSSKGLASTQFVVDASRARRHGPHNAGAIVGASARGESSTQSGPGAAAIGRPAEVDCNCESALRIPIRRVSRSLIRWPTTRPPERPSINGPANSSGPPAPTRRTNSTSSK